MENMNNIFIEIYTTKSMRIFFIIFDIEILKVFNDKLIKSSSFSKYVLSFSELYMNKFYNTILHTIQNTGTNNDTISTFLKHKPVSFQVC